MESIVKVELNENYPNKDDLMSQLKHPENPD